MSYIEETDEGITDLPTDTTDLGVTDTEPGLDEEEGEEEQSEETEPIQYNTEDLISSWYMVENCSVPENILEFDHSYGYDCKRYFNLVVADENTIMFVSGNFIHFLDVASQKVSFRRSALGGGIGSIVKNPNPEFQHIAIAENGQDPLIIIYEWPSLNIVSVLRGGAAACYTNLSYSPDGLLLVSQGGEPDNLITIWNWRKSRIMLRTLSSTNDVYRVVFSPSVPGHLTTCGLAHIKFWKMAKTFTGLKLKGELGRFGKTEYTDILGTYPMPDEKVVSGCFWGNILVWDEGLIKVEVFRRLRKKCHEKPIVQFDYKDGELWTFSQDGHIKVWYYDTIDQADPPDEDRVIQIEPSYDFYIPNTELMYVKKQSYIDDDSTSYFAQDGNGGIWCIDLNTEADPGPPVQLLKCHAGPVADIAACPWGSLLCSLGKDGRLYIYNYFLKIMVFSKEFSARGCCMIWLPLSVDPSGDVILLGFEDGVVRVGALEFSSDAELEFILIQVIKPHKKSITAMTVNSEGTLLITGGEDSTIFVLLIKYVSGRYVKLVPIGYVPTPTAVSCLNWHNESDATIIVGCVHGQIMQVKVPTEPVSYTKITYVLKVNPKYQNFVTYKAQIRRDIKIAEINAKKKVKRDKKRVEMEKIMKDNPGLEVDEEVFLADSESDEELEPLYIPPIPNRILWIQHLPNDNFWLSMAGYDAGYVYQYHIDQKDNIPLKYRMVPDADDTEISSYIFNDSKSYLILAMQDGRIRVTSCDAENVTDLSDYWIISMHDNYNGFVPRMCFGFDEKYFFTCGHDGNIFSYRFNVSEEEYIKPYFKRIPTKDEPTEVNDIINPNFLSLEEAIIKKEEDRKFKLAENNKAEIRKQLQELRKAYTAVLEKNKKLLKTQIIPREDLEIDDRIAENLRHHLKSDLALVKRKLAFEVEKSEVAMMKIKNHFTDPLDVLPIQVAGVRGSTVVRTMRQRNLGKEFYELLELVEQKIIEAEIRGRAPMRASVVQGRPPPIVIKDRPLEYFLLGLSPSTIQNKLGAKLNRLLYKYRQRKVKKERRQQEVTLSKNTKEQPSQTDPVSSTSHPIHTPHHPLHHDRPALFPFNPSVPLIDPIGPMGGIGRDVGRDDLHPAVGGGLLGGPGRFGGGVPDMDIFGGGGMLFEPPRGGRIPGGPIGPGNLGVPPGSIPPGARFDPFRPPEADRFPGPPRRPNAPDNDEFGPPGWDDMYMWDRFNLIRPQEGINHPDDKAEVLEAEATVGDFKMKTAHDFKVPTHLRTSTVKKYKSLLMTRLKQFELRHEFNMKVYEMRDRKVKLRQTLIELEKKLKEIHVEVPESMRKHVEAAKVLIDQDIDFPERNLDVILALEDDVLQEKSKPIVYGATLDLLREEVLEFRFEADHVKEELTPWEEEIRNIRGNRKLYEQDLVIKSMDDVVKSFDDELYALWEERTKVMVDATFLDLHLLTLNQELIILKNFEANEDMLSERVHTTMQDLMDQQDVVTALTKQIENTKRTIENLQEDEKALNQQFMSTMSDYKFFDFLRRIFKKKYKPPKIVRSDDSESDSDSSSDSSSDEEEDAGSIDSRDIGILRLDDSVCPKGCDQAMYDLTFTLRSKRHGVELEIKDKQTDLLTQKKDLENAQKKLKLIENNLKMYQEELESFHRKKQQKLNEVSCTVVISAHQIQNITPQNDLESINQSLIFSKTTLSRLYKRVGQLQTETIQQKVKHSKNVKHLNRMNTDITHMTCKMEELKTKIIDLMKLKFGGLKPDFTYINAMQGIQNSKQKQTPRKLANISLDEIEECVIKRLVYQLRMTMIDVRGMYEDEMKRWQKKYVTKQNEHIEFIRENTKRLELIAVLKREIRELSKAIDYQKAKVVQLETVLDISNVYKEDLKKLSIIVENQSKELDILREEIKRMRTKGMQRLESKTFANIEDIPDDVSSDWSDYEGYFKKHNLYTEDGKLLPYFEGEKPPEGWLKAYEDELKTTNYEFDVESIVKRILCSILSGLNVVITENTMANLINVVQNRRTVLEIVDDIAQMVDEELTEADMRAIESSATQLFSLQEPQATGQERDVICQEILMTILNQLGETPKKQELGSILRELIESLPMDYLSSDISLSAISQEFIVRQPQLTRREMIQSLRESVADLPIGLVTAVQSFLKLLLEHVFSTGMDYLYVIKDEENAEEVEYTRISSQTGSDMDSQINSIMSEVMLEYEDVEFKMKTYNYDDV